MRITIPKKFIEYAEKTACKYKCKVLDITLKPEKKSYTLRVTIDGDDTSLNMCADISRELSKWLDSYESEIKCPSYNFEVSSPGPDRKLHKEHDFINCINKIVYFETKTRNN